MSKDVRWLIALFRDAESRDSLHLYIAATLDVRDPLPALGLNVAKIVFAFAPSFEIVVTLPL